MNRCSVFKQKSVGRLWQGLCLLCLLCSWLITGPQGNTAAWAQGAPDSRPAPQLSSLGASACVANARLTGLRNSRRTPQPLDATARYYLRPWFGKLVDTVRVVWQARLNDHMAWRGYVLRRGSRAQTYGYQIYVARSQGQRDPGDTPQLLLLAHEFVHTEQYVRYGGSLARFCQAYVKAWEQSGWVYTANALEQEAFARVFDFAQWLARQFPATSQRHLMTYTHEGEAPQGRTISLPRRLPVVEVAAPWPLAPPRPRP